MGPTYSCVGAAWGLNLNGRSIYLSHLVLVQVDVLVLVLVNERLIWYLPLPIVMSYGLNDSSSIHYPISPLLPEICPLQGGLTPPSKKWALTVHQALPQSLDSKAGKMRDLGVDIRSPALRQLGASIPRPPRRHQITLHLSFSSLSSHPP